MTVHISLRQAFVAQREQQIVDDLGLAIARIMAPFNPGKIELWLASDTYPEQTIHIRIEHWDQFKFPVNRDFDRPPLAEALDILQDVWRERYIEPDNHIHLGLE